MEMRRVKEKANEIEQNIKQVIIGKDDVVRKLVIALLSQGHVLLEDVPGSGKTMLAKSLAQSIDGEFKRIQLTPDLLPADITGINYYNNKKAEFEFVKGPVFSNILIADEVNRATPKTQSGLLESMEERQVTIEGNTYKLEDVFMVIATQNPIDTQGVFPLPEAQIDRFVMKLYMEYPSHNDTIDIFKTHINPNVLSNIKPVVNIQQLLEMIESINTVKVNDDLIEYVVNIIEATRDSKDIILGVSNRGGLALLKAARAVAAVKGRDYVLPDDIKYIATDVLSHRLVIRTSLQVKKDANRKFIEDILEKIPVPTEEALLEI